MQKRWPTYLVKMHHCAINAFGYLLRITGKRAFVGPKINFAPSIFNLPSVFIDIKSLLGCPKKSRRITCKMSLQRQAFCLGIKQVWKSFIFCEIRIIFSASQLNQTTTFESQRITL